MDVKKDILWRVYLVYLGIVAFALFIIGKAIFIQRAEGKYWISLSDSLHLEYRELDAERGTIFSEDGSMLSTSIPYFDVRIDFGADGLREKEGKNFYSNVDSLSIKLYQLFGESSALAYKQSLIAAYKRKERYHLLRKNISFREYQQMIDWKFLKSGRNKSGFIFEEKEKRMTPFGLLANRTIGLSRQYLNAKGEMVTSNVGLEKTYDQLLRGENGKRLVRRISGGAYVPIEGTEIEPENGHDVITTIDVNIQDITENALMKMMVDNECEHGTCIVMEVKTGKIKAIANLGKQKDGTYFEDFNYAITKSEPGSTFKLMTMMALFEDHYLGLNNTVDLEGGIWKTAGRVVRDSEQHGKKNVSVKQAFSLSSNVGMAKLATAYYANQPRKFLNHIYRLGLDSTTGIGIVGETKPLILNPSSKYWSATTLPWMSFGYNLSLTPLHTLMLYNAIANEGVMMKPYLVSSIMKDGKMVQEFQPVVKRSKICSDETLKMLKECLEDVVLNGTGKTLQTSVYTIAGKTGTALVADGSNGYSDHIYQSSFAGYFPAENPRYSCIVVIKNKPSAKKFYGAAVAGPVFREVADKLYAFAANEKDHYAEFKTKDSTHSLWAGWRKDFENIFNELKIKVVDSTTNGQWISVNKEYGSATAKKMLAVKGAIPNLKGMGLKDAIHMLENMDLKVVAKGFGKINQQSLAPGTNYNKGQTIYIELN
ncbi:MAG: penicillin-binding protein [Chitinophagaceae bacterium]